MSNRRLIVGIAMLVVLCLFASTAVWGEKCKRVNANLFTGPLLFDPAPECNGYTLCQAVYLDGTPNGTMWTFMNLPDGFIEWDDGTFINITVSVLETKHGELFFDDRAITAPDAPEGFVLHSNVTGGTGRYEGATGWLAYYLEYLEGNEGIMRGEICYADED